MQRGHSTSLNIHEYSFRLSVNEYFFRETRINAVMGSAINGDPNSFLD